MTIQSSLSFITIDRGSSTPIYLQLESKIRDAVLTGVLHVGVKLPSTRRLSLDLNVSRIPVQSAYEQLITEGFLVSKQGAGTFVSKISVENLRPKMIRTTNSDNTDYSRLTERSKKIKQTLATTRLDEIRPFRPGIPGIDLFPKKNGLNLGTKR